MSWIKTISYQDSIGRLRGLYNRVKGPGDNVDNIMIAHSLRPHTMEGHMALYKRVLHHSDNTVPKWFLETIGVWVSILNDCPYCVNHHAKGMERLIDDRGRAQEVLRALENRNVGDAVFTEEESRALTYAEILTRTPGEVTQRHVDGLVDIGYSHGEILEINQVVAYFNYANRTVLGLGVVIEGDLVGLSPGNSDDPSDWSHK